MARFWSLTERLQGELSDIETAALNILDRSAILSWAVPAAAA
jgi:hypothetical protein